LNQIIVVFRIFIEKKCCPSVLRQKQNRSADVIPASEVRRESFFKTKKDSGQAGMTEI
jgi:hypothetical protein